MKAVQEQTALTVKIYRITQKLEVVTLKFQETKQKISGMIKLNDYHYEMIVIENLDG